MLEQVDIPTLAALVATTTIALLAMLIFVATTRRVYPGFRLWILGLALVAVSAMIAAAFMPRTLESVRDLGWFLSWTTLLTAVVSVHAGSLRFRGRPAPDRTDIALVTTALLLGTGMTALDVTDSARLAVVSFPAAFVLLRCASALARRVRFALRPAYYFFAVVLAGLALVFIARSTLFLLDPYFSAGALRLQQIGEILFYFGGSLCVIAWAFGSLLVTGQRQEVEMLDVQAVLRDQAGTDVLTGLANRRRFFEEGGQQLAQRTGGQQFSVLLLDIDHFKKINDAFGHDIGDLVLRNVARTLRRGLPRGSLAGRIGGEEFAILVEIGGQDAVQLAESLRLEIASNRHDRLFMRPVTVSLGVTPVATAETALDTVLRRADAALYEAKQSGRNRVEIAQAAGNSWARRLRSRDRAGGKSAER